MGAGHRFDELLPPWLEFPEIPAEEFVRHLKQGPVELWVDQQWRPFWASLSRGDRAAYFDYWDASAEWRDVITFHFERNSEFDAESDPLGSAERLAESRGREPAGRGSLFSRLFGKKG